MESSSLVSIKEHIEKERSALRARANKLEEELAAVELQLDSLSKAIAALNGEPAASIVKKPTAVRKKSDKPAAGKAQVATFLQSVLEESDVLDEATLREQVEAKLTEAGYSRMGFALRFKEALQQQRFVETSGGIRLREQKVAVLQ